MVDRETGARRPTRASLGFSISTTSLDVNTKKFILQHSAILGMLSMTDKHPGMLVFTFNGLL